MAATSTQRRPRRRRMTINDLPVAVFTLACGHNGRDRGIAKGDQMWCTSCAATKRVTKILAQQGGLPGR